MAGSYLFNQAENSTPLETSWSEAQQWCNFVLFKPHWLPGELIEQKNTVRPESPIEPCAHRVEFYGNGRSLSIKQFLYDWAPPAYDHPCLWRNAKISNSENTPLPKPYLIGNNYLWLGLDYRRKSAATINLMRTQIEMTVLSGEFEDEEIIQIVSGLTPAALKSQKDILGLCFAELTYNRRHESGIVPVPTSYFNYIRDKDLSYHPYSAVNNELDLRQLLGNWLASILIDDYRLDSLFLIGSNIHNIKEVEYYFESEIEPGSYVRFLTTEQDGEHSIQFPPKLGDQECEYAALTLENGEVLYHAWSKNNEHGCHSLVFKAKDTVVNCIIKPSPWTTVNWARHICSQIMNKQ